MKGLGIAIRYADVGTTSRIYAQLDLETVRDAIAISTNAMISAAKLPAKTAKGLLGAGR